MSAGQFQGQRRWKKQWQPRRNFEPHYEPPQDTPPPPAPRKPSLSGQPDLWCTLQIVKDHATNSTKTTRAMRVPGGIVVNTCTRGANYAAEALVWIAGADLIKTAEGHAIVERASA